jgi:hypothetical protein
MSVDNQVLSNIQGVLCLTNVNGYTSACHELWVMLCLEADTEYDKRIEVECIPSG